MSASNEPNFDWSQAASLLGDDPHMVPEDMTAIVKELIVSAEGQFEAMKSKNAETERKAIGSLAHQLRGCLLNFGFTAVGEMLMHLEKGEYTSADYLDLTSKAEAVFVTSKKMLAGRYPSLGL